MNTREITILGIDPGSQRMGVARIRCLTDSPETVVDFSADALSVSNRLAMSERLAALSAQLRAWIGRDHADLVILEKVFLGKNVQSAFTLGQARGAVLAVLGESAFPTEEVAVRSARKSVCGRGEASKEEIRQSLELLLSAKGRLGSLPLDASDALALAYHGWREHCLRHKLKAAQSRQGRIAGEVKL